MNQTAGDPTAVHVAQRPSIGRIVRYNLGIDEHKPDGQEQLAAIVTRVHPGEECVDLCIFNPGWNTSLTYRIVVAPYPTAENTGWWSWPERV